MNSPTPSSSTTKDSYRQALQKFETLHGNMAVLSRLGTLLRDVNTGIDDVAKLLQTDGALSANVIRVSNSILYGSGPKTIGLHDALIKVGYNQILSLIGAALSKNVFMKDMPGYRLTANEYWSYSYFCAVFVETQATRLGHSADEAYLVGLLHAIGRVVINELLINTHMDVYWDKAIPCEEWEDILLGFRHDKAGALLLQNWKFSPSIYRRVEDYKSPKALKEDVLLQVLDYARQCAELNNYNLEQADWKLPENHPFALTADFDTGYIISEIERTKQVCLQIRHSLVSH